MSEHPGGELLEAWLRAELSAVESKPVLAHLVRGCADCSRALAGRWYWQGGQVASAPVDLSVYDFPVTRALRMAVRQVEDSREAQEPLTAGLATLARRGMLPSAPPSDLGGADGRRWCEELLAASRDLLREDPQEAIQWASLAVTVAELRLDGAGSEPALLADLRAQARADLGNARRAADDLAGAEADLTLALEYATAGSGDPLLVARITDLCASLFRAQRRLDQAAQWLERVFLLNAEHGEPQLAGRALISKGLILGECQDYAGALCALDEGLRRIDSAQDPRLVFVAVHGMADCLAKAGRYTESERLLAISQPLYATEAGDVDLLKRRWIEGQIAAGRAEHGRAETILCEALHGFEQHGMPYAVALVTLDLAGVYLAQGRLREVEPLAARMLTTFQALEIRREAIAAVLLLSEAVRAERLTVKLLREVTRELQRLAA